MHYDDAFIAPGVVDGYLCDPCTQDIEGVEQVGGVMGVLTCAKCGADLVPSWGDLDFDVQDDLIEWYNTSTLDAEDKARLVMLYTDGMFRAYDCGHCGHRVRQGTPDDWGDFQGALQDYDGMGDLCGECCALCDTLVELRGD